jgi:hypothetical protein
MTASSIHASAESPTAPDRFHGTPLGGSLRDPGAGSARSDRDWQLLEALRLREPTAAERLVATYGDSAYRLAVRITRNGHDAEDAVQDAFWSVVRKIGMFRDVSAFGS